MSYAQMRGKNVYVNPLTGNGLYFSENEKQITSFNHENLTIINLISNGLTNLSSLIVSGLTTLSSLIVSGSSTLNDLTVSTSTTTNDLTVSNDLTSTNLTSTNLTVSNSTTLNDLTVSNDLTSSNLTVSNDLTSTNLTSTNLTVSNSTTLNDLTVSNSSTFNDLTLTNLTISNSLTVGTFNVYFGIATLSPTDTTSYPAYISNPGYGDGHGNSNYTITQSVNTIVGCVINPINSSRFFITYVSQTSSNQIYVSWVNLTNGSYSLPTNISYILWAN
jgi:hypothetical protein